MSAPTEPTCNARIRFSLASRMVSKAASTFARLSGTIVLTALGAHCGTVFSPAALLSAVHDDQSIVVINVAVGTCGPALASGSSCSISCGVAFAVGGATYTFASGVLRGGSQACVQMHSASSCAVGSVGSTSTCCFTLSNGIWTAGTQSLIDTSVLS